MFEVKGTSLQGIISFVEETYGTAAKTRWLMRVSEPARTLATGTLAASGWYDGKLAMELRKAIIDEFMKGDQRAIRALGRHSANQGLRGIYRLALKVGSPAWVVERLSMLYSSYLRPGEVHLKRQTPTHVVVELTGFTDHSGIMDQVLAGFVERALELSGAKEISVERQPLVPGSDNVALDVQWQ